MDPVLIVCKIGGCSSDADAVNIITTLLSWQEHYKDVVKRANYLFFHRFVILKHCRSRDFNHLLF